MKKKKSYIGEGQKRFISYLPDEVFNSLTPDERESYRNYRQNQKNIGNSLIKISKYQDQIRKLNLLIKGEKNKINGDGENGGWEMNLKRYYERIIHIDRNFHLNCSIEKRDRSSVSKRIKEGIQTRVKKDHILKNTYGKKEIGPVIKLYGRVENLQNRQQIYLGDERKVRKILGELLNENFMEDPFEFVKDEMKSLLSQYSRYKIYHNKWEGFKGETHNLNSIIEWTIWCENNGINRYEWGGNKID